MLLSMRLIWVWEGCQKMDGFMMTTSLTSYSAVPRTHSHVGIQIRFSTYTVLFWHRNTNLTKKVNYRNLRALHWADSFLRGYEPITFICCECRSHLWFSGFYHVHYIISLFIKRHTGSLITYWPQTTKKTWSSWSQTSANIVWSLRPWADSLLT